MSTLASYLDLELIGPSGPVTVPGDIALPSPAQFASIYRGPKGDQGDQGDKGDKGDDGDLSPPDRALVNEAITARNEMAGAFVQIATAFVDAQTRYVTAFAFS